MNVREFASIKLFVFVWHSVSLHAVIILRQPFQAVASDRTTILDYWEEQAGKRVLPKRLTLSHLPGLHTDCEGLLPLGR